MIEALVRIIFAVFLTMLPVLFHPVLSSAAVMLDRVVAVVNQEVIAWSELYRQMEAAAPAQVREWSEEERKKFYKASEAGFLESLIDERLQLQEAKALNIRIEGDDGQEAVEGIKKKYGMTDEELKESLKKQGYSLEEYRKRLAEQIAITKVVNRQVRAKILISDEDITKFLNENRELIDVADSYRISQIFFRMPKNDSGRAALLEKARGVYARAKAGENFRDLAREFSEDSLASSGGDLGLIKKADLAAEFNEALARMKVGDVSMPFWTERGLHIIRLDEKTEIKDQAVLRAEARQALFNKLFAERYKAWLKGLREKSFIEVRL